MNLQIGLLAEHPETIPTLIEWFETEWADYYGPSGPGNAAADLAAYASRETLPVGLVAFVDGQLAGMAALKPDSISTRPELGPWAAAGLVAPAMRGQGIGLALIQALEKLAACLGYSTIYCGTSTAATLLERAGWDLLEDMIYHGEALRIYQSSL